MTSIKRRVRYNIQRIFFKKALILVRYYVLINKKTDGNKVF